MGAQASNAHSGTIDKVNLGEFGQASIVRPQLPGMFEDRTSEQYSAEARPLKRHAVAPCFKHAVVTAVGSSEDNDRFCFEDPRLPNGWKGFRTRGDCNCKGKYYFLPEGHVHNLWKKAILDVERAM